MQFINENFWFAICFTIFIYFAYRPFKKILFKLLDAKIEEIKLSILKAEELRLHAEKLLKQTKSEVENLVKLKNETLLDARQEADKLITERSREIDHELDYKKSQINDWIYDRQAAASEALIKEFTENTARLVEEYLKATDNQNMSDVKIAELLASKLDSSDTKVK